MLGMGTSSRLSLEGRRLLEACGAIGARFQGAHQSRRPWSLGFKNLKNFKTFGATDRCRGPGSIKNLMSFNICCAPDRWRGPGSSCRIDIVDQVPAETSRTLYLVRQIDVADLVPPKIYWNSTCWCAECSRRFLESTGESRFHAQVCRLRLRGWCLSHDKR